MSRLESAQAHQEAPKPVLNFEFCFPLVIRRICKLKLDLNLKISSFAERRCDICRKDSVQCLKYVLDFYMIFDVTECLVLCINPQNWRSKFRASFYVAGDENSFSRIVWQDFVKIISFLS